MSVTTKRLNTCYKPVPPHGTQRCIAPYRKSSNVNLCKHSKHTRFEYCVCLLCQSIFGACVGTGSDSNSPGGILLQTFWALVSRITWGTVTINLPIKLMVAVVDRHGSTPDRIQPSKAPHRSNVDKPFHALPWNGPSIWRRSSNRLDTLTS